VKINGNVIIFLNELHDSQGHVNVIQGSSRTKRPIIFQYLQGLEFLLKILVFSKTFEQRSVRSQDHDV